MGATSSPGRKSFLEDDALINLNTTDVIEQTGCTVRSYLSVEDRLAAAQERSPDIAVLDLNIRGKARYELADWLHERKRQIIFITGYENPAIEARWHDKPVCRKLCAPSMLRELLLRTIDESRS